MFASHLIKHYNNINQNSQLGILEGAQSTPTKFIVTFFLHCVIIFISICYRPSGQGIQVNIFTSIKLLLSII